MQEKKKRSNKKERVRSTVPCDTKRPAGTGVISKHAVDGAPRRAPPRPGYRGSGTSSRKRRGVSSTHATPTPRHPPLSLFLSQVSHTHFPLRFQLLIAFHKALSRKETQIDAKRDWPEKIFQSKTMTTVVRYQKMYARSLKKEKKVVLISFSQCSQKLNSCQSDANIVRPRGMIFQECSPVPESGARTASCRHKGNPGPRNGRYFREGPKARPKKLAQTKQMVQ